MDIVVTPLDPADATAAEQAYQIVAACTATDRPDFPPACRRRFLGRLAHPWPGHDRRPALAYAAGVPAGYLEIELPCLDNVENATVEISVHPAHRRRGVGRALHEYAVRLLRGLDRKRITGMSPFPLPRPDTGSGVGAAAGSDTGAGAGSDAGASARPEEPGSTAFATAMGATDALVEVRRRLDIGSLDEAALDALLAAAWKRADGYSLVCWSGPTPPEYVADVAYLEGRLLTDAPMGDLDWEPEQVDASRVRGIEAAREARGQRAVRAGMRHDASGRLVAFTELDITGSSPWHAFQQITLVDPGHRGHRLGTIIKIENLRAALAHEPALRAVDTWNAAANTHMIAINEALGFRPVDQWHNWQLTL